MRIIGWLVLVLGGGHCLALGVEAVEMQMTDGNKNLPVVFDQGHTNHNKVFTEEDQ